MSPNEITGKKVITPPQAEARADIQALLAQEEAKEQSTVTGGTVQPVPPQPAVAPAPVQAAPLPQQPATAPTPQPAAPAADGAIAPPPGDIFQPNQNGSANEHAL